MHRIKDWKIERFEDLKVVILLLICIFFIFESAIGYNIYWANLHSHTSLSDGRSTPEHAFAYARDTADIDVLAITDHTHYLTHSSYQYLRNVANQFTIPGEFVAIAGQEFGSLSAFGHFSIFEAESLCPVSVNNLDMTYQWIAKNKVQIQFNHPRYGDFDYLAFNRAGNEYASMIEIVNGSGNYTPFYEERYIEALNLGWHIAPVANQDNHRANWGNQTTIQGQIPLSGIWAEELTKEKILEAISKKRVYACEVNPVNDKIYLNDFAVNHTKMGDVCYTNERNVNIKVSVSANNNFAKIYLFRNGVLYDSAPSNLINQNNVIWLYSDTITFGYYFVKGVQEDGDRFWSAPIWVIYQSPSTNIQVLPHPIRGTSQIKIPAVANADTSEMLIYTIEGNLVYQEKKAYSVEHTWNGLDKNNRLLANGVYLIVIRVKSPNGQKIFQGKVTLLRQ
ncbi:MAG: CehA/McbA family metallohydrolase [candidate division WOR-3 bacterium]|nr:CehA/McbA family metallohydrolase [candidate division WOR-3 bacterium]